MFIHYDATTDRVTGITEFIFEIPAAWDRPTLTVESFDFIYSYEEYKIQNGLPVHVGKTTDQLNLELNSYKTDTILGLSQSCEADIISGFTSNALGTAHTYQSDRDDQLNLIGMVSASMDDYFKCFDGTVWDYKLHTALQFKQVLIDGKNTKLTALQKFNTLKEQVLSATTKTVIDLIVW